MMKVFLNLYVSDAQLGNAHTGCRWMETSLLAAKAAGRGMWLARNLRMWARNYINNREAVPSNIYGRWNVSALADEDLANELHLHLQSKGKWINAMDIVRYMDSPDIKMRHGLKRTISLATAQRWMRAMNYRWKKRPKGQYVDGHEREDVVKYRQETFLPAIKGLEPQMRVYNNDGESQLEPNGKVAIVWTHDESTYYANDRRTLVWYHADETAKPLAKGEGVSLMVADLCSADYGFLRSPDGTKEARVLFRAGKNRDGYFTNEEICDQLLASMDLVAELYPDEHHVFVFDNAKTHLKRPEDGLSALNLSMRSSKPDKNFLVLVTKRDEQGKPVKDDHGQVVKEKVRMRDGTLPDGTPQPLYFPPGHAKAGLFKGMRCILEERGIPAGQLKLKAQCDKSFSCRNASRPAGSAPCCCRKALYDQPDFRNQKSRLEELAEKRGYRVLFYPKFHCELNFIEQVWGYSKRIYRMQPESTKDEDLERNVLMALESVPLISIRRFANRSLRFMDAYQKGLNGSQAAWASKKYRGHRILPQSLMEDLDNAKF